MREREGREREREERERERRGEWIISVIYLYSVFHKTFSLTFSVGGRLTHLICLGR
jgi:hypothetical protein